MHNKATNAYVPILSAFRKETLSIIANNPGIPEKLISYLVGRNDFYKVIKRKNIVEIISFNLNGSLGQSIKGIKPETVIQKLKPPTKILSIDFHPTKLDTLNMYCDMGWQISFRIHSAETIVQPSLKFDINMISHPTTMYSNHVVY